MRRWTLKSIDESQEIMKSFMTKEELINMLNNLNFQYVDSYEIELITGFYYNSEKTENNFTAVGYGLKLEG